MSFKKRFAVVMALAVAVAGVGVKPADAAERSNAASPTFIDEAAPSVSGCVVSGFAVCDGMAVPSVENIIVLQGSEVPMTSESKIALDQEKAAEEAEKEAQKIADQKKAAKKKYKKALRLLAAIVYCEAGGQCYAGRLAVAAVVMNRVKSGGYPNTIHGVLWQPYQFGPIRQGKMARELGYYDQGLYKQPERSGSLKAAKDILAGKYTVVYNGRKIDLKKYHNFNGHLSNAKIRISGHDFA